MTYSLDLRKSVLRYLKDGHTQKEAANIFNVYPKTVTNWVKKDRDGNLAAKKRENKPRKLDYEQLIKYIKNVPDAYLREIAKEFKVSITAIFYACKRLKITLKKRPPVIKNGMKLKEQNI